MPARLAVRTFQHLWQPLQNVAWMPSNRIFLRALEVPAADPAEVPLMVEFELERLSPLPVADILWTCEVLPGPDPTSRTALVIIAARATVEQWLGTLESGGFVPDRLEPAIVRELLAVSVEPDSAWLLVRREAEGLACLAAWWAAGRLRHVELRTAADDDQFVEAWVEGVRQTVWAGEIGGWHGPGTRWHLVAEPGLAGRLQAALAELAPRIEIRPPVSERELAAQAAASANPANLVPAEARTRHRQQYVDRLWMRSLGVVALVYVIGVLAYFAALNIQDFRKSRIDYQVALLHSSYTNALAMKARVDVLSEQVSLKFAALDCLKAASDALPADMTLTQFSFQRGQRVNLFGTVPTDLQRRVTEFNEALAQTAVNGRPLFSRVSTKSIQATPNRPAAWTIECELRPPDSR